MFGLLDLFGNSFLPLMQFGFWVLGLNDRAEALIRDSVPSDPLNGPSGAHSIDTDEERTVGASNAA